jgi:hypothetical protein
MPARFVHGDDKQAGGLASDTSSSAAKGHGGLVDVEARRGRSLGSYCSDCGPCVVVQPCGVWGGEAGGDCEVGGPGGGGVQRVLGLEG